MNRQQQRQAARDQKRLAQRQKGQPRGTGHSQPALVKRPAFSPRRPPTTSVYQRSRLPWWWALSAAAVLLIAIGVVLFLADPLGLRTPLPGTSIPSQGNVHTNPGESHVAYTTDPPASGPHFPTVPRRGTYTTPFVTEYLPHFMEHAGVVVQYSNAAPPAAVEKLNQIVDRELDRSPGLVLLAPRPAMPCEVALTSWGRIQTFGAPGCQPGSTGHSFDPNSARDVRLVKEFIQRNECAYDPENQCGSGAHGNTLYGTPPPAAPTVIASSGTPAPASSPAPATATPGALPTP